VYYSGQAVRKEANERVKVMLNDSVELVNLEELEVYNVESEGIKKRILVSNEVIYLYDVV
jgi:hypothetical protein